MRKHFLSTLVCLLLVSGLESGLAQTGRRRVRSRGATSAPAARAVYLAVDARGGELLGSFNGRTWSDALKTMPLVKEGETFRLYSLKGAVGTGTIGKPKPPEYPCDDMVDVTISPLPEGEDDIIAVNGSWDAQPRPPKIQSTDQQEYRDVVSSYLRRVGISRPKVTIFQVLRVDLDGDGTEEVLISANSADNPSIYMSKGDFSVILLRRVARGRAQTIPIVSEVELKNHDVPYETGNWHHKETVAGILDINGDGVMEVVTNYQSVYDAGKIVYEVKGIKPKQVLYWGCSGGH